ARPNEQMRHVRHAGDAVAKRKTGAGVENKKFERGECEAVGHAQAEQKRQQAGRTPYASRYVGLANLAAAYGVRPACWRFRDALFIAELTFVPNTNHVPERAQPFCDRPLTA